MKKKLICIFLIFVLIGATSAVAIPISEHKIGKKLFSIKTGIFNGVIYDKAELIGNISGEYVFYPIIKDGFTFTRLMGQWEITSGEYAGNIGNIVFTGGKNFQIGKITNEGLSQKISIICQISFSEINYRFSGNIKLFFGPVIYISGDYQQN